ncbi:Uncharacterized protein Rs2_28548 [Raphanus sativus]|nr:Uncharacterized protein Rs2_28548 [Raphanus sativus]
MNSMNEESNEQPLCLLANPTPPFYVMLAVPPHHVLILFLFALKVESLKMVWLPAGFRVTRFSVQMIFNQGGSYHLLLIITSFYIVAGCRCRRRLHGIRHFQYSSWKHNDEIVKNRRITQNFE